jgi:hypothetical protein
MGQPHIMKLFVNRQMKNKSGYDFLVQRAAWNSTSLKLLTLLSNGTRFDSSFHFTSAAVN